MENECPIHRIITQSPLLLLDEGQKVLVASLCSFILTPVTSLQHFILNIAADWLAILLYIY